MLFPLFFYCISLIFYSVALTCSVIKHLVRHAVTLVTGLLFAFAFGDARLEFSWPTDPEKKWNKNGCWAPKTKRGRKGQNALMRLSEGPPIRQASQDATEADKKKKDNSGGGTGCIERSFVSQVSEGLVAFSWFIILLLLFTRLRYKIFGTKKYYFLICFLLTNSLSLNRLVLKLLCVDNTLQNSIYFCFNISLLQQNVLFTVSLYRFELFFYFVIAHDLSKKYLPTH